MDAIGKVAVLGIGVLGSQIAFQVAYSGFEAAANLGEETAVYVKAFR